MLIYSLPLLRHFADRGGRGQSAEKVQAAKGSSPSATLSPPTPCHRSCSVVLKTKAACAGMSPVLTRQSNVPSAWKCSSSPLDT